MGFEQEQLSAAQAAPEPAVVESDVQPVNGGPDRGDLSGATVDDPSVVTNSGAALAPTDPNQAAGAQAQWQSIREAAQAQGFQFDHTVTDDRTALNFLMRQAQANRAADVHAQLGRQLAPHANGIQQYLQSQKTPAAPTRREWEAPAFDKRWAGLVERDPSTGMYVGKPGVPPHIVDQVNEYVTWKEKYDENPGAMINAAAEAKAKTIAAETFREQFAAQAREQSIQSIVNENSQWLYQVDQSGQRLRGYDGQQVLTPLGARYIHHLQGVQRAGVADPKQQDYLAKQLVRGEYATAAQQQAFAAQQQSSPQTQQAISQPNRNPLQALPPTQRRANPHATEPSDENLSLMERMRRDLKQDGVTDDDIYNSSSGE